MFAIPTLKISISGVRGVIGDSLSPTLLTRFAQAFGTYLGSGTIVIGRDPRTSGEMVKQAVLGGLLSSGCRVVDVGMCPVPTVQMMVRRCSAQGGLAITASHNPPEWNALKFIGTDGLFLGAASAREMLDIYHQGEYTKVTGNEIRGVETMTGAIDTHIDEIIDKLGPLPLRAKRLRVVLDACNGAGSIVGPRLLEALGAEVFVINDQPNGQFPRPAEPLPENLGDLCKAVIEHGADVGFAQDMDADRLAIVSNEGKPIGEDYTLVLATTYILGLERGPVVANLSTTDALDFVANKFNCPLFRTRIGEANVTERMQSEDAVIGGEGNGGVIYPRINFARDSLVGMSIVLHLLAKEQRPLTEILAELPRLYMVKEKLSCPSHKIKDVLRMIREVYKNSPMDLTDGVKVTLPHGWLHVRGSNTEPIIRLSAEADSPSHVKEITASIFGLVKDRISS
jgi:phosphomannomutase